jgi:putative DNA primase/helicase
MRIAPLNQTEGSAAELAKALGGRRSGRGWIACCPAHDDRDPSLSIADGADGRVLLTCFAGCGWSPIRDALEARSLWPGRKAHATGPAWAAGASEHRRPPRFESDERAIVKRIWREAASAPGTQVETYLRSRSLTTPVPPTLRYHRLRHRESGRSLPCMVAAVQADDSRLSGLHRTFLRLDGRGKADVEPVKKMLGACRGGAVRLAPAGRRLALCEGIETGLSIREACPDLPVWCSLSAGNLDRLTLPPEIEEVVLVADGDPVGLAVAHLAAQRYGASGRRIRLVELPGGMDANDLLRREAVAA